jgi:cell division protein FtsW
MDKRLYISTVSLLFISLVAVYSLSVFTTIYFETSNYAFIKKQLISVTIGIFFLTLFSKMNPYTVFKPLGFTLFIGSFIAIAVMLFLPESLVRSVLGAKRWIKFGSISIAPTEFFKYGFVFFVSWSLDRKFEVLSKSKNILKESLTVFPYFLILIVASAIIAIGQKDLGQVVVLVTVLIVLLYLSGMSKTFFYFISMLIILGVVVLIKIAPHRIERFKGWWVYNQDAILSFLPSSWADSLRITDTTTPLNILNSTYAIHNGSFLGQGIGNGQFKLGYLSEVHTDFILSGISEEIGVLGILFIVGLFLSIIYHITLIASKLHNLNEKLFAYGVATVLAVEFLINVFGITGTIPIKGIAVPLLSYGGSQIIATSMAIGMVLMLSRKVEQK